MPHASRLTLVLLLGPFDLLPRLKEHPNEPDGSRIPLYMNILAFFYRDSGSTELELND